MISRLLVDGIDWEQTSAFCWSDYGTLSVNAADRFEDGFVSEGRRAALVDEIAEGLLALRDPQTGERVMSAPLRAEEIYHGPRLQEAPDLLAVTAGYRREILTDFTLSGPLGSDRRDRIFAPAVREGTHRLYGMLGLSGQGIRPGFEGSCARIEDITPTLLHLMGERVPSYMDGRVLSEMLQGADRVRREDMPLPDDGSHQAYTDDEVDAVERDLQGLGYL
jgi:predicted AlkP superfamily phosphohydrolase/phosphomutase